MSSPIRSTRRLGFPWETRDPFLFSVHHDDRYPRGTPSMGVEPSLLAGRDIGQDFSRKDGWSMYHGDSVPGFPQHPHRGFETITVARRGHIDHSDSLGAAARFGQGDVQWMTAGRGVVHSEMFPLLRPDAENPVELFQIWINLPREKKLTEPHFTMLWSETIPVVRAEGVEITVIAGELEGRRAPSPPPASWASRADADVAIWAIKLAPGARVTLPAARRADSNRGLYFFRGGVVQVAGAPVAAGTAVDVDPSVALELKNGDGESEILLLQGVPIAEPVVQYGPFVMNSPAEIRQAFADYQETRFGGWPWSADDPVHPRDAGRFARRPSGDVEHPPSRTAVASTPTATPTTVAAARVR